MENETEEHHEEEKSEVIFDLEETEDLGAITVSETDILQTDEDAEENDEVEKSGECGLVEGTVFWELDGEGTLHLYGSGEMIDWSSPDDVPWAHCSELIKKLDIQEGVSGIGTNAFSNCNSLTTARIG